MSDFKIECSPELAPTFYKWVTERGGVQKWMSADLGDQGASCCTPLRDKDGKVYTTKPSWKYESEPRATVFSADEIGVYESELFKAFPVRLKLSGLTYRLSDSAQRNLDKTMAKCRKLHGDAFYRKGVLPDANASMGVFYTVRIISLAQWVVENGPATSFPDLY